MECLKTGDHDVVPVGASEPEESQFFVCWGCGGLLVIRPGAVQAEELAGAGASSWELDALDPATLDALIEDEILSLLDRPRWDAATERMEAERRSLTVASENWPEVVLEMEDRGWLENSEDSDG